MRFHAFLIVMGAALISADAMAQSATKSGAHSAEIWLSNDTLQLRYITGGERVGVSNSRASVGFFLSEDRDIVLDGELLFPADLDLGRLKLLFGPRAYVALLDTENDDVLSLAVGAELRFDLDAKRDLAIVGNAFYAPDILTFGSADNLTDLSARAEMRLATQLTGFAGMRWFEFDLTDGGGTSTLQEEVFIGVGWKF